MTVDGGFACIQQANAILGEGPIWDWRSGDLFWVDIRRRHVFRHHLATGQQTGQWAFKGRVGCVALTDDPSRVLVAAGLEIHVLELDGGACVDVAAIDLNAELHRINDGEVDSAGRLWVGTMMDDFHQPASFVDGCLHRFDPGGSVTAFGAFDFALPNGIGWSPDDTQMYVNDSAAGLTYVFDYDATSGTPTNRRVLYQAPEGKGLPDGMSVDAAGNVWCALWDGWGLIKLSPEGEVLERIDLPVRRPSSATFCGDALQHLAITSATVDFTSEDFDKNPQSGGLFLMPAGCTGRRPHLFPLGQMPLSRKRTT